MEEICRILGSLENNQLIGDEVKAVTLLMHSIQKKINQEKQTPSDKRALSLKSSQTFTQSQSIVEKELSEVSPIKQI